MTRSLLEVVRTSSVVERTFDFADLHCWLCAATVEEILRSLPGVRSASVEMLTRSAVVTFDASVISEEDLIAALSNGGVRVNAPAY